MSAINQVKQRQPWWRWKRVWAVSAAWLLAAYPASLGPVHYADAHGWIPLPFQRALGAFHSPVTDHWTYGSPTHRLLLLYVGWWRSLASDP